MKKIFNYYLDNHILDILIFIILFGVIIKFNIQSYGIINNKSSLYTSLIGLSAAFWSFGILSATILVTISSNNIFEKLLKELGNSILKKIFISLIFIFIDIILFSILNIKLIQKTTNVETAIFLFAIITLFSNALRFTILLYGVLKVRIG